MTIHRTFTRGELARALDALGRSDIVEGLYSRRVEYDETDLYGLRSLALDFDEPADLALFLLAMTRVLSPDEAEEFAASLEFVRPAHPASPGAEGARWPRWVLAEHTAEEWADEIRDCPCSSDDEGRDCRYGHDQAPWDRPVDLLHDAPVLTVVS